MTFMPVGQLKALVRSALGASNRVDYRRYRSFGQTLTVFCFHEVGDARTPFTDAFSLAVSMDLFRRQIEWIAAVFEIVSPRALADVTRLPQTAALITFDDGMAGAVTEALPWLASQHIPSVMFLNMRTVLEGRPMVSAVVSYLEKHDRRFSPLMRSMGIRPPFHVGVGPSALAAFVQRHGQVDLDAVNAYQGAVASLREVRELDGLPGVSFGNHLFDHWNAASLRPSELEEQFVMNAQRLSMFANSVPLFAFPNGQPGTCWRRGDVEIVRKLGAERAFAGAGGVNGDPAAYVLDRIAVGPAENTVNRLWYRHGKVGVRSVSGDGDVSSG
jgi:peptidoglycan/xylan/chitin deacetylase (PgdA/CDA1 family)